MVTSFAVAETAHGGIEGWARRGPPDGGPSDTTLRLTPGHGWQVWTPHDDTDELHDRATGAEVQAIVPRPGGGSEAIMTTRGPVLRFDAAE